MKQNLPAAVAQLSRLNDPASKLRRSELSLPAPQVTDSELEDVARLTADEQTGGSSLLLGSSDSVLRGSRRPLGTRTPLVSKADDTIAQEARNAALERTLQTPLLGSTNPTASRVRATSARRRRARRRELLLSRWLRRPHRYSMDSDLPDDATTSSMMPSLKQARRDVREGSAALPAPKFAYDVDVPDAVPEEKAVEMELEPDARAVDEAGRKLAATGTG